MKIIVQFSGGKDSQASLIWAVNKFGAQNVWAVFNDTHWEHPATYNHLHYVTESLGVRLITIDSIGFANLAVKKKMFPSARFRFCTENLKIKPFIDWLLGIKESVLIIQGIRAAESYNRSQMSAECRYFRYFFEPYKIDPDGRKRYHSYRKKEVLDWCSQFDDSVLRPVFSWSGQEVIDYIISNNQKPNPLYYRGNERVGCYPCVLSSQVAVKNHYKNNPELPNVINALETKLESGFFKYDAVPLPYRSGTVSHKPDILFTTALDMQRYLSDKYATLDLFEVDDTPSCSSYYHLCE